LAVQGQDKGAIFCEKCFTNAPKGSEYCPNCGAPFGSPKGMHIGDPAVYPRLAHANLLRMRKQYKHAEDECLSILRQYPNNLAANVLLGDIAAERGDMVQAAEWYELALDLDADAPNLQDKLDAVRERKEEEEAATTAQQLGLPVEKPRTWLITAIALTAILIVGLLAYIAYQTAQRGSPTPQNQVDRPIVVGKTPEPSPVPPPTKPTTGGEQGSLTEDAELQHVLATTLKDSSAVISAWYDPVDNGITITYSIANDSDGRELGANMATEAFGVVSDNLHKDIDQVQLRGMRDRKLAYTALVKKTDYQETQTKEWQEAHKDDADKAFLDKVLTKEKRFEAETPPAAAEGKTTAGTTTAGTAGSTSSESGAGTTKPTTSTPTTSGAGSP